MIVLQDVAFTDLQALVEFIYHGEVNVHQRSLSSFLKTAEVLRVSGLTHNDDAQGVSLHVFVCIIRKLYKAAVYIKALRKTRQNLSQDEVL